MNFYYSSYSIAVWQFVVPSLQIPEAILIVAPKIYYEYEAIYADNIQFVIRYYKNKAFANVRQISMLTFPLELSPLSFSTILKSTTPFFHFHHSSFG